MKNKITYSENILFEYLIPNNYRSVVKKSDIITSDKVVFRSLSETKDQITTGDPIKMDLSISYNVEEVSKSSVLFNIPGTEINLLASKGKSVLGELILLSYKDLKTKKFKLDLDLENKIIFLDYLEAEGYPKLSALGVSGIIVNSIDFNTFNDLSMITAAIGIYSNFGFNSFDDKVESLLKKYNNKKIIFDTDYNRVIIPATSKPSFFMSEYDFNPVI